MSQFLRHRWPKTGTTPHPLFASLPFPPNSHKARLRPPLSPFPSSLFTKVGKSYHLQLQSVTIRDGPSSEEESPARPSVPAKTLLFSPSGGLLAALGYLCWPLPEQQSWLGRRVVSDDPGLYLAMWVEWKHFNGILRTASKLSRPFPPCLYLGLARRCVKSPPYSP